MSRSKSKGDRPGPSDEELMEAYVEGDLQAFEELFRRYAQPLTRIFRSGLRNPSDADELLQETFLHLHRARHDFNRGSTLRPYLVTIALNLKREHLRRKYRRPEHPLERDERVDGQDDPERRLERGQSAQRVRAALAQLPENHRRAIELHWYGGMPFAEVAESLGASPSAVRVWAHRGYKALRQVIEKENL